MLLMICYNFYLTKYDYTIRYSLKYIYLDFGLVLNSYLENTLCQNSFFFSYKKGDYSVRFKV